MYRNINIFIFAILLLLAPWACQKSYEVGPLYIATPAAPSNFPTATPTVQPPTATPSATPTGSLTPNWTPTATVTPGSAIVPYTYNSSFGQPGTDGINGDFGIPDGIAISPDDKYIAVSDFQLNNVQVFNGSFSYLFTISGISEPHGMTFDSSDRLYVTDWANARVDDYTITNTGATYNKAYTAGGSLLGPSDVKFDNTGNLVIADLAGSWIYKDNSSTDLVMASANIGQPMGVAVDGAGSIYATDLTTASVKVYNSGYAYQYNFTGSSWPKPLAIPAGILVDKQGNLVVADEGTAEVIQCDTHGNFQQSIGAGTLKSPVYMAWDPSGDLFVVDSSLKKVLEFIP